MTTPLLSEQLRTTAKVLAAVWAGRSLNDALADGSLVKPNSRAGIQALSFIVMRHLGMAQTLRALLIERPPAPMVDALLCTALALMVSSAEEGGSYTEFTLVNQTVEAAKSQTKTRTSANFLNAVLRRFLRERPAFMQSALQSEVALYNHPQWWIDQVRQERPQNWQAILLANQIKPPLTVRVNLTQVTLADYRHLLQTQGIDCTDESTQAGTRTHTDTAAHLALTTPVPVMRLPHFEQGWCSVQDMAAQHAARQLLSPAFLQTLVNRARAGEKIRVLDACAAPGGKTTHLLELVIWALQRSELLQPNEPIAWGRYFEVVALELDPKRVQRIHENLSRLKLRATVKTVDASRTQDWWDGTPFDAVLLDAPCTASGIVRRHPDVRWLRRPQDSAQMGEVQLTLLRKLWPTIRVGGRLLYATCSIFEAEGDAVVKRFIGGQQEEKAKWLDSQGLWFPCATHDGFYDALFEKIHS